MNRLSYMALAGALLVSASLLPGCKSSKGASSSGEYPSVTSPESGVSYSLETVAANYREWADVSVPVTLRLTAPKNISVSARARMVRDRCIDLSFRMLGFEVARVWITPDSLVAASRPKKVYLAESLSKVTSGLPVNLGNLQDLLIGRPFIPGGSTVTGADSGTVYLDDSSGSVRLLPRASQSIADYGFVLDLPAVVTALAVVAEEHDVTFTASYSGPQPLTPAGNVMDNVDLTVSTPRADYAASVSWRWKNARWNEAISVEPPVTEGLRRVTSSQLMKIIKDM